MAHRRNVDHVRVRRVDDDPRDVVRVGETARLPGRAAIDGLEHALARI